MSVDTVSLEVQSVPLPNDIQYYVDESLSYHSLNPFDHNILCLYGDRKKITKIIEEKHIGVGWENGPGLVCRNLDLYAHELAAQLPVPDQRTFFASSLAQEPARIMSLVECCAQWNYVDATEGGMMENRLPAPFLDRFDEPTPKVKRRLASPKAIRQYVKHLDCDSLRHARFLAANLRRLPWPLCPSEGILLFTHFAEAQQRYEASRIRALNAFMLKRNPRDKAERRRMVKAALTAQQIVGREAISAFLRGDTVRLTGEHFTYAVTGYSRVVGHGGLQITLEAADGTNLAGLCYYIDNTPAAEQLAAMALTIETGDELSMIKTGNLYAVTMPGHLNEVISERIKTIPPNDVFDDSPLVDNLRDYRPITNRQRRERKCDAYVEAMKPEYTRALTSYLWGSDEPRLRAFLERLEGMKTEAERAVPLAA